MSHAGMVQQSSPSGADIQAEGHFFGDLIGSRFQPAISCTRELIRRRKATLSIRVNAAISRKPSELETKSSRLASESTLSPDLDVSDAPGESSKKNAIGTCRI